MKRLLAILSGVAVMVVAAVHVQAAPILFPSDLSPGDPYHLAFVTSQTRDAASTDIADYDAFVQSLAAAAGLGAINWKVIGSTDAVDAIAHLDIVGPVYRLDDTRIANDEADLFDGSIFAALNFNEFGDFVEPSTANEVFTGSMTDGTEAVGFALGDNKVRIGLVEENDGRWIDKTQGGGGTFDVENSSPRVFYAISEVIVIPEPSSIVLFGLGTVGLVFIERRRRKRKMAA